MFNHQSFKRLLVQYTCGTIGWLLVGCSALTVLVSLFMTIGLMAGEWAFLHILAMYGIASGFAVLASVFIALHVAAGGRFFVSEGDHAKTVD